MVALTFLTVVLSSFPYIQHLEGFHARSTQPIWKEKALKMSVHLVKYQSLLKDFVKMFKCTAAIKLRLGGVVRAEDFKS